MRQPLAVALQKDIVARAPAAACRETVQKRRKRSDREIFERFPLYLVPTYPGDHALFTSPGFQAWLPDDLPLVRGTLEDVMEWGW